MVMPLPTDCTQTFPQILWITQQWLIAVKSTRFFDYWVWIMLVYYLISQDPQIVRRHVGEFLFPEGEAGRHMYLLTRGTAEILLGDNVVEDAKIGAIVGEMAVIEPRPRSASVRARGDCDFVESAQNRFDYLVSQTPQFATRVMRIMVTRLRTADTMLRTH